MKQFFGSGFGRFRLVSRWCLGLFASKATACVLLFEAFGSGVLRPDFATGFFGSGFGRFRLVSRWCLWDFSLLRLPLVFCCSRLSGLCFAVRGFRKRCSKARFRNYRVLKSNVRQFFGLRFWPLARVRMLFPSSLIEGSCALSLLFLSVVSVLPLPRIPFAMLLADEL